MKEQNREKSLVRRLVALLAAAAVGVGLTLTGCAPEETEAPEDSEEPAMPGEPAPGEEEGTDPAPLPEPEDNGNGG